MFKRIMRWFRRNKIKTAEEAWCIAKRAEFLGLKKTAEKEFQSRHDEPQILSEQRWLEEEEARIQREKVRKGESYWNHEYAKQRQKAVNNLTKNLKALDDETTARIFQESLHPPEQQGDISSPDVKRLPAYKPYQLKAPK